MPLDWIHAIAAAVFIGAYLFFWRSAYKVFWDKLYTKEEKEIEIGKTNPVVFQVIGSAVIAVLHTFIALCFLVLVTLVLLVLGEAFSGIDFVIGVFVLTIFYLLGFWVFRNGRFFCYYFSITETLFSALLFTIVGAPFVVVVVIKLVGYLIT